MTNECVKRIVSGKYDVVICNLANCDMVGHTGEREAVIRAVEKVDESVGRIVRAVNSMAGIALITADHGNAEKVAEPDGSPDRPYHEQGPVYPCGSQRSAPARPSLRSAPTMLELMGLQKPLQMTGRV